MGIKGTKTWDDIQTFKAASGTVDTGSYTTAGAWTLGPSAGIGDSGHTTNGSLIFAGTSAAVTHSDEIDVGSNYYLNFTGSGKASATVTGYSIFSVIRRTSSGSNAFQWSTNYQDAQTAGSSVVVTNNRTVGSITAAGAWTLGVSGVLHQVNGQMRWDGSGGTAYFMNAGLNAAGAGNEVLAVRNSAASSGTSAAAIALYDNASNLCGMATINQSADTAIWGTSSDVRLKTLFEEFDGMAIVQAMRPLKYERLCDPGVKEYGFIAQDLNEILPQCVAPGGENPQTSPWIIDYGKVTAVLAKALQELKAEKDALEARIAALENP